jgi:hypothetical protein
MAWWESLFAGQRPPEFFEEDEVPDQQPVVDPYKVAPKLTLPSEIGSFLGDMAKNAAANVKYPLVAEDFFLKGAGSYEGAEEHLKRQGKVRAEMGFGEHPNVDEGIKKVADAFSEYIPDAVKGTLEDPRMQYTAEKVLGLGGLSLGAIRGGLKTANMFADTDLPDAKPTDTPNFFDDPERGAINMFDAADVPQRIIQTVSTRIPSAAQQAKQKINAHTTPSLVVASSVMTPEKYAQAVDLLREYPAFKNLSSDPVEAWGVMNEMMQGNLKYILDRMPEEYRKQSMDWYIGFNRIAHQASELHRTTPEQAAGVIAANSPQTDWDVNLARADRIMDAWNDRQDQPWTSKMTDKMAKIQHGLRNNVNYDQALFDRINGRSLGELTELRDQAAWIRIFDEAENTKNYYRYNPDGSKKEIAKTKGGKANSQMNWASMSPIENSLRILRDGSMENISKNLGNQHKVRSFYRNAADYTDPNTTTIDTHAVAANMFAPFSGTDMPVKNNFGNTASDASTGMRGTYPLHQQVYNDLSKELGIPSRQLQSMTWEQVRMIMKDKKNKTTKRQTADVWTDVAEGRLTPQQARDQIYKIFE